MNPAVDNLLVEAQRALEFDRAHLVVIADGETTPLLLRGLAEALAGEAETITLSAGSALPDLDASAVRVLLLPDALSVPAATLRALHEATMQASGSGVGMRLVLFVDRDATPNSDPTRELVARLGVGVSKIELDRPRSPVLRERATVEEAGPTLPPVVDAGDRRRVRPIAVRSRSGSNGSHRVLRWLALAAIVTGGLSVFAPSWVNRAPLFEAQSANPASVQGPEPERQSGRTPEPRPEPQPERQPKPEAPESALPPVGVPRSGPGARAEIPAAPNEHAADVLEPEAAADTPAEPAPILIGVNLNAKPWATITIDGRDVGPTPIADLRLAPGDHDVVAKFPDGRVVERAVHVDALTNRFRID